MDKDQIDAAVADYEARYGLYVDYARRLEGLMADLSSAEGVEPAVIESRAKEPGSLRSKLDRTAYSSLEDITDLCGVRVIVFQTSDVERVAAAVRATHRIIEEELHGEQRADAFGYRSLHMLVAPAEPRRSLAEWAAAADLVAEIQVRTVLQHAWAAISHKLDYKSEAGVPQPTRRKLFRVAALLETGDELFDQFRADVDELKVAYSSESRSDRWEDLELNRESLLAVWDRIDWNEVTAWAADEVGFADPRPSWTEPYEPSDVTVERLAAIAQEAGLGTAGELGIYIQSELRARKPELERVRATLEERDKVFWAIGPDVVALALLVDHPSSMGPYFLRDVRDAIRALVET